MELKAIEEHLISISIANVLLQGYVDEFLAELEAHLRGKSILDVPYLSQWDIPDADDRPGDCGPACVAMLAHFLTSYRPTVDQAASAAGQPIAGVGRYYTNHAQLIHAANVYGPKLKTQRPLTVEMLESEIDSGRPAIALVNYGALSAYGNQDDYRGAHWLLVVGYDDEHIYVNDSNFWGDRRDEGRQRKIPRPAFDQAMGTVSETPGNSFDWQGLVMVAS